MATTLEVAEAIADALTDVSPVGRMSVDAFMVFAPAADCQIDIYPADPAEEDHAMGPESVMRWWTIRLRVPANDRDGQQEFLYGSRDQTGPTSVRAALLADRTLGGVADNVKVGRPSGFNLYEDSPGSGVLRYVGQEWRVGVMLSDDGAT